MDAKKRSGLIRVLSAGKAYVYSNQDLLAEDLEVRVYINGRLLTVFILRKKVEVANRSLPSLRS